MLVLLYYSLINVVVLLQYSNMWNLYEISGLHWIKRWDAWFCGFETVCLVFWMGLINTQVSSILSWSKSLSGKGKKKSRDHYWLIKVLTVITFRGKDFTIKVFWFVFLLIYCEYEWWGEFLGFQHQTFMKNGFNWLSGSLARPPILRMCHLWALEWVEEEVNNDTAEGG